MQNKKIGQVEINYFQQETDFNYQDFGDVEQFLFDFFEKPESQNARELNEILSNQPSWEKYYHLSPQRKFILDWYPFAKGKKVLEIGGGCGAVTGALLDHLEVHSNELSPKRAEILARRFADRENLKVNVGSLQNLPCSEKFHYLTSIGVLEYAGLTFGDGSNNYHKPYLEFLKTAKSLLQPDGHLLLAIENKLGYKYLSGAREDHGGSYYDSIEEYPYYHANESHPYSKGLRTFTKNELTELFKSAGFKEVNFYYPFPDYKFPIQILTEEMLNKQNMSASSFSNIFDYTGARLPLFSENLLTRSLLKEHLLANFSNSFLVDAR